RFLYFLANFLSVQPPLRVAVIRRCGQSIFECRPVRMHFHVGLIGNFFFQGLTFPEVIQTDIGRNPVDPSVKTRLESKTSKRSVGLKESLLENFSRLLAISQHVER